MNNFIIQKQTLKFTVEVSVGENDVALNIIRHINVDRNECLSQNAQLARYDALSINNSYLNCHTILHGVIERIKDDIPENTPINSKIILKKGHVFGRS